MTTRTMFLIHSANSNTRQTFARNETSTGAQELAGLKKENQDLKLQLEVVMRLLDAKGVLPTDEVEAALRAVEVS